MTDLLQATRLVEADRLEELDDVWLAHAAARPDDLDFFVGVAELLVTTAGGRDRACLLLELLDEQLREGGRWSTRLRLLRRAGVLYLQPAAIHEAVMLCLQRLYDGSPSLEGLIEKLGLRKAVEDTPKLWRKLRRLRQLMQFEVDTIVHMEGKGAGRILEVNLQLESFKLDLAGHPGLRVGFAAASKLMRPLPRSHIERQKLEQPDALVELGRQSPGELLRLTLCSHDRPMTATEIRKALTGVVSEERWSNWWSEARKHPQVLSLGSKGRPAYGWASSEDDASETLLRQFEEAEVGRKLEIFRANSGRPSAAVDRMKLELQELAESLRTTEPGLALTVWFALERCAPVADLSWGPASLLRDSDDVPTLVASVKDRSIRERLYLLTVEELAAWPQMFRGAMEREHDPRLLSLLADHLSRRDIDSLRTIVDDALGHPRRRPTVFVWLAEQVDSLPLLNERNPLRLLRQILDALHQSEFSSLRARLQRTLQPGGRATSLLARLDEEQASKADSALARSPLDEPTRESLRRFLRQRFPSLDSSREVPLYATPESIAARRQELRRLREEEIPANRRAVEEARALGDLRENFEYKAARQRHEYLNARVAALEHELSRVRPLEPRASERSEARIGCRLELQGLAGKNRCLTILGPWESDPERGIVSYDSELGRRLLGKQRGDSLKIDGETWTLTAIEPWI